MKRLITFLLAVVLTAASFSAAPALASGVDAPVITAPTDLSTHLEQELVEFGVDFSQAPAGTYELLVTNTETSEFWYHETYDTVASGESASFIKSFTAGDFTFSVLDAGGNVTTSAQFTVRKPVKKPSKPRNLHSARGNHKVRLAWKAPKSNGGAKITKYQVKRHGLVRNVGASKRSKTFTGLTNGHKYSFWVRAKNKAGWSKWAHTTGTPKKPKPKPKPSSGHPVKAYQNCTAMHHDYPHGVGRSGAHDQGGSVTNFYRSTATYNLNTKSDRDKDGIACESA